MDKEIVKLLKKIEKYGFQAYIVGGYVRDYFLGNKNFDIDIATSALPKDLLQIFPTAKYDKNYGSIKIITNKFKFDITTFRKEIYQNDKLEINYINDILEDAKRRDFTINAIYMNKFGEIIDPFQGISDLQNKIIRVIGNPEKRFTEDSLRILRCLRFKIQLDFKLEKNIIDFIKENKELLKKVSFFRKKDELNKIFAMNNKISGLNLLKDYDLLPLLEIDYKEIKYTTDPLGIWSQLTFSNKYPFTKEEKNIIERIKTIKKIDNISVYQNGLFISLISADILEVDKKEVNEIYNNLPIRKKEDIKINYKELIKLGYKENEINDIIKFIEKQILLNNCLNNYESICYLLKKNWK